MVGFSGKINMLSGAFELHSIAFLRGKEQKIKPTYIVTVIDMQFNVFKETNTGIIFQSQLDMFCIKPVTCNFFDIYLKDIQMIECINN